MVFVLPWHLAEFLGDGLDAAVPHRATRVTGRPAAGSDLWRDLDPPEVDALAATWRPDRADPAASARAVAAVLAATARRAG